MSQGGTRASTSRRGCPTISQRESSTSAVVTTARSGGLLYSLMKTRRARGRTSLWRDTAPRQRRRLAGTVTGEAPRYRPAVDEDITGHRDDIRHSGRRFGRGRVGAVATRNRQHECGQDDGPTLHLIPFPGRAPGGRSACRSSSPPAAGAGRSGAGASATAPHDGGYARRGPARGAGAPRWPAGRR